MRILFVGDTHFNSGFWKEVIKVAADTDADRIVQVGDFGFYPAYVTKLGEPRGVEFLASIARKAKKAGIPAYFIKGNHEDHDSLEVYVEENPRDIEGFVDVVPCIPGMLLHAHNGHRWNWDGVEFAALGGAFSVDWQGRTPGVDWWPGQEEPNEEDLLNLGDDKVNILITHDSPQGAKMYSPFRLDIGTFNAAERGRAIIKDAIKQTRPEIVVHGHWHQRKTQVLDYIAASPNGAYDELPWASCVVESLGRDGSMDAFWMFDTEKFRAENEGR